MLYERFFKYGNQTYNKYLYHNIICIHYYKTGSQSSNTILYNTMAKATIFFLSVLFLVLKPIRNEI